MAQLWHASPAVGQSPASPPPPGQAASTFEPSPPACASFTENADTATHRAVTSHRQRSDTTHGLNTPRLTSARPQPPRRNSASSSVSITRTCAVNRKARALSSIRALRVSGKVYFAALSREHDIGHEFEAGIRERQQQQICEERERAAWRPR